VGKVRKGQYSVPTMAGLAAARGQGRVPPRCPHVHVEHLRRLSLRQAVTRGLTLQRPSLRAGDEFGDGSQNVTDVPGPREMIAPLQLYQPCSPDAPNHERGLGERHEVRAPVQDEGGHGHLS
jgi:hypothetical protein